MPMTLTEKVLARAAGKKTVQPGDFLEIEPDLPTTSPRPSPSMSSSAPGRHG
jgi:homoaconitase/3-isopropylmalate dehydratase large subunit